MQLPGQAQCRKEASSDTSLLMAGCLIVIGQSTFARRTAVDCEKQKAALGLWKLRGEETWQWEKYAGHRESSSVAHISRGTIPDMCGGPLQGCLSTLTDLCRSLRSLHTPIFSCSPGRGRGFPASNWLLSFCTGYRLGCLGLAVCFSHPHRSCCVTTRVSCHLGNPISIGHLIQQPGPRTTTR